MHEGGAARHDVQEAFERDGLAVVQGFASDGKWTGGNGTA